MTAHRDLKKIIRDRQQKTGESYTTARIQVIRARDGTLDPTGPPPDTPTRVEAAVLKVNLQSARLRILGKEDQITLRSSAVWSLAPGHIVTLSIENRWTWRGNAYATGRIEDPRIDVAKLGLEPLPLTGGEPWDLRESYQGYEPPDPYEPLWRENTAPPRADFQMDPICWGAFPGAPIDRNPVRDAVVLAETSDVDEAREALMELLLVDLRCLDAHAHLGLLEFDHHPERALVHYEIGAAIGGLSLPPGFDGVLVWGQLYNRPFLRCLHGHGLCLWRLGRLAEAERVFARILRLNPNDNQGARFCWQDVRDGRSWDDRAEERSANTAP